MAKNPDWSFTETAVLLENYQTKEMYELEEIMASCDFPRPPEGIKRRLERLLTAGMPLDEERIEYLTKRKLWRKETYLKFKEQLYQWRKNNPLYSKRWFAENPEYLRNWLLAHPSYYKNRHSNKRVIS